MSRDLPDVDGCAEAYVRNWERAAAELDSERLRALRQLTETEAAERFARLLVLSTPYPLRKSSGLVELQRILSRLRDNHR